VIDATLVARARTLLLDDSQTEPANGRPVALTAPAGGLERGDPFV
jgi:hypothetical protein